MPLYLLVDQWDADGPGIEALLHPVDGEYTTQVSAAFGEPIALPAPFDVEIDTTEFPRP